MDIDNPRQWSPEQIRHYFDKNWAVTVQELATMTGRSVPELKRILLAN